MISGREVSGPPAPPGPRKLPLRHSVMSDSSTTLSISVRHLHAVERHAAGAYPEECCGFLVGRVEGDGNGHGNGGGTGSNPHPGPSRVQVHRVLPARNESTGDACSTYCIAPETVLAARREARRLGLEVVGYYHSHPDGRAEPSGLDADDAWRDMSYLIVAVEGGAPEEIRSWRLGDGGDRFEEEVLRPVGDPAAVAARLGPGAAGGGAGAGSGDPG